MTNDERLHSNSVSEVQRQQKNQTSRGLFNGSLGTESSNRQGEEKSWRPFNTNEVDGSTGTYASTLNENTPSPPPQTRKRSKRHSGGFLLGSSFGKAKRHSAQGPRDSPARDSYIGRFAGVLDGATPSPRSSRSLKSQGKAPATASYSDHVNGEGSLPNSVNAVLGADGADGTDVYKLPVSQSSQYGSVGSQSSGPSEAPSSIDSNQLINMALALSEGRRRAASGVYKAPQTTSSRRVVSSGNQRTIVAPGSPLSNDLLMKRMSARQSRYMSPTPESRNVPEPPSTRKMSTDPLHSIDVPDVEYEFSISTLQRAERARKYFEVSHQYRRLLRALPPLKPHSTAPGNVTIQTQSVPGSPFPEITRTLTATDQKHEPGRAYNPLQYLRNEKLRKRQGSLLGSSVDEFDDPDKAIRFVDEASSRMQQIDPRDTSDVVALPSWHTTSDNQTAQNGHQRDATASSRILWFDSEWSFTPMALFADTVWTESPKNKWALENRRGNRIFPDLKPPEASGESQDAAVAEGKRPRANTNEHADRPVDLGRRGRQKRKFLSIHKLDDDERRRLPWRRTRSVSSSRASSRSPRSAFGTFGGVGADGVNIGPLVRHMQKQMQQGDFGSPDDLVSPDKRWDELPDGTERFPDAPLDMDLARAGSFAQKRSFMPTPLSLHKSRSFTEGLRINTNSAANGKRVSNLATPLTGDLTIKSAGDGFGRMPTSAGTYQSSNLSPRMTNGRVPNIGQSETSYVDFANANGRAREPPAKDDSAPAKDVRQSFESTRSFNLRRHGTNKSVSSTRKQVIDGESDRGIRGHGKSMSRLLKGSRLAELVRGDSTRKFEKERFKEGTRSPRGAQPTSAEASEMSDSEDEKKLLRRDTDLSISSIASEKPKYHIPLPSFKFPNGLENGRSPADMPDSISRQQSVRREQSRDSRHSRLGQLHIDVPGSTEPKMKTKGIKDEENQGIRGLLSPIKRLRSGTGPSRPRSIRPPLSNHGSTVDIPARIEEPPQDEQAKGRRQRQWSIANQLDRPMLAKTQTISMRDIERVKALFLSSGVKACELCRRGETESDEYPVFLLTAQQKTGKQAGKIAKRDECRTAGRMWSEAILQLHRSSEVDLQHFRENKIPQLRDRIDKLRHVAGEELTTKVQSSADDADGFTTDLTTHQTLAVKNVHDAIDSLLRRRRRNWRMMRRVGFTLLEWLLLGIMWLAWFIVTLVKMVKTIIVGILKVIGWLFFL
ncbi:hypothetical protein C1H76_0627 [Elsinoe australis]|uniref:Uncharacterized protein n=1 Tax=Elsinoe australis TaxID=40998 RepID=A0A4U7BBC2_9PEZI|nr:hypothetical protein C1H76_0627 [Elsinoe australis]